MIMLGLLFSTTLWCKIGTASCCNPWAFQGLCPWS